MNIDKLVTQTLRKVSCPCAQLFWNDETNVPDQYITWTEISRKTVLSGDDKELCEQYYISVDIFSRYGISYSNIIDQIEKAMKQSGFRKATYSSAKYENATGYVHKPLSFKYYKQK